MYHIWGFLLQTVSVSIVAVIILSLKKLFEDKLSPRWQYGIWSLLAIRIIIPVNTSKYVLPQAALWIETLKAQTERSMDSVFSAIYEPIVLKSVLPVIIQKPQSITDWLFLIYVVGVGFCLIKYFVSYTALRLRLMRALPASDFMEQKMITLCEKYSLKPCKMIAIEGVPTAFICGVLRPKLVVPYAKTLDEKILLHELLHKKYGDTLQNIFWCILRALHWCNPLLQYVMHQIENDMEALCDQRVLELLDGEERRDYGIILLDMANQKYARNPGTSSISNGSKNIAKRIAAIVRFKKYPQGMALVSVCIIFILFWPTIIGSAHTFTQEDYNAYKYKHPELDSSMAIARIQRCGTVAGALDMYAKGLYLFNGIYVASASSLSEHAAIEKQLEEYGCYQSGEYFGNIVQLENYYIYNIDQKEDTKYEATICFRAVVQADELLEELLENLDTEEGLYSTTAYIFVPVAITYEDAWVVEEIGERSICSELEYKLNDVHPFYPKTYAGKNADGEVLFEVETKYTINNEVQSDGYFWSTAQFDTSPKPNAQFNYYELNKYITYTHTSEDPPLAVVNMKIKELENDDYFPDNETHFSMGDHTEQGWIVQETIADWGSIEEWDSTIMGVAGGGYGEHEVEIIDMPSAYSLKLTIDDARTDSFILQEVSD